MLNSVWRVRDAVNVPSWVCTHDDKGEGPQHYLPGDASIDPEDACGGYCKGTTGCYAFDAYADGCTFFASNTTGVRSQGLGMALRGFGRTPISLEVVARPSGLWPGAMWTGVLVDSQIRSRCQLRADCGGALEHGSVVMLKNARSGDLLLASKTKVDMDSRSGKARLVLHDNSTGRRSKWTVDLVNGTSGSGLVRLRSEHDGNYLHVLSSAHHSGDPIVTENVTSSKGSQWNLTCIGNQAETTVQLQNLRSDRYLHVDLEHVGAGSPVCQHKGAMSHGNFWVVVPVVPVIPPLPEQSSIVVLVACCLSLFALAAVVFMLHKRWKVDSGTELVVGVSGLIERRDPSPDVSGGSDTLGFDHELMAARERQRAALAEVGGDIGPEGGVPLTLSSAASSENPIASIASCVANTIWEEAGPGSLRCGICLTLPADAAFAPCGHQCGCLNCLEAVQRRPEALRKCPVCRGQGDVVLRVGYTAGPCLVCGESGSDCAVEPCGHRCGCHECVKDVLSGVADPWHNCPVCLGPVTSVVQIFS